MLREEQIDSRRRRAVRGKFCIQSLGRSRVFSDYQVSLPAADVRGAPHRIQSQASEVASHRGGPCGTIPGGPGW